MSTSLARRVAGVAWASCAQFFILQWVVAAAWTTPFSLSSNYISDLGNTSCGPSRVGNDILFVCSPLHTWMNVSIALFGLGILVGAGALMFELSSGAACSIGLGLLCLAGVGPVAVALFPEDVNLSIHKAGAAAQFICGNLALVVLGVALRREGAPRVVIASALLLGAIGVASTTLFAFDQYLGIGIGTMERTAAYPAPCVGSHCGLLARELLLEPRRRAGIVVSAQSGNTERISPVSIPDPEVVTCMSAE